MNRNFKISTKLNHRPILFNLGLWFFTYVILLLLFSNSIPKKIDYAYTIAFVFTLIPATLINFYVLIPKFLKSEKYILYLLLFLSNAVLFTVFNYYFFEIVIDKIFTIFYFISFNSNLKLLAVFIIFLIISTLIKLTEEWIFFNKKENEKLQHEKQLVEEKLRSLRSQINPHFLFNSLNTIYAMAIDGDKKITKSIVQLSDILRYVIYDTNTSKVKISKEIELIDNYLSFQKSRLKEKSFKISFQKKVKNFNFEIYPMLLLPLVENAFKHGLSKNLEGFLNITIVQQQNEFNFKIENNFEENQTDTCGVGLKNIQKNLEIIYPNKHKFNIKNKANTFIVNLKIVHNETN